MCTPDPNVYPARAQNLGAADRWPGQVSELSKCITLLALVFVLLAGAGFGLGGRVGGALFAHGVILIQLWAPMARADATGHPLAALGMHGRRWRQQLAMALALALVLWPLWAAALGWARPLMLRWQLWPLGPAPWGPTPGSIALWLLAQVLGVALPEELFWRGYVQPVLEARFGGRSGVGNGLKFGRGTAWCTLLFAAGHVAGGAGLSALGTFFPGCVFALLRARTGSIVAAVALHAGCNIFAAAIMQTFDGF
jgi:membrane protease YdiL (CAAX protease family)